MILKMTNLRLQPHLPEAHELANVSKSHPSRLTTQWCSRLHPVTWRDSIHPNDRIPGLHRYDLGLVLGVPIFADCCSKLKPLLHVTFPIQLTAYVKGCSHLLSSQGQSSSKLNLGSFQPSTRGKNIPCQLGGGYLTKFLHFVI